MFFASKPGDDLRKSIEAIVKEKNIEADWINTCVGGLTDYTIRFANRYSRNCYWFTTSYEFTRKNDGTTEWEELQVTPNKKL